jgi:hypothetical protein
MAAMAAGAGSVKRTRSPDNLRTARGLFAVALCLYLIQSSGFSRAETVVPAIKDDVDWSRFLARHDLVWDTLPTKWTDGAFLGNGQLGAMIYQPAKPWGGHFFGWTYDPGEKNALRFDVSRRDISDHRDGARTLVHKARLENGHFLLTPSGAITGGAMRLDLFNAEVRGRLLTDKGRIDWRALVLADRDLMVIDIRPSEGEQAFRWEWKPALSETTRLYKWDRGGHGKKRPQDQYPANPSAERGQDRSVALSRQPMLAGGDYTTAWKAVRVDHAMHRFYVTVAYRTQGSSADEAVQTIRDAETVPYATLEHNHRAWWADYFAQSFLSIPAPRIESFYWIQMYKLGAASRADKPAMDLMGPWFQPTLWPGTWWNLNIQLAYYPVYTANRLSNGENLCRMLDENVENLVQNGMKRRAGDPEAGDRYGEAALVARVTAGRDLLGGMFKGQRGAPEIGNLTWALHNYWRQCRYAGDDTRTRKKLIPLLRRAINFYLPMLEKDENGTLHLPPTYSPEIGYGPDCNYDMALLDWGCKTLVSECTRLGIEDPLLPKWRDVIAYLADFPANSSGYLIARGKPLEGSHRHYSHLLMVYPLYLVNWDQAGNRDLMLRSVEHWASRPGAFAGYSYSGAASMYASMSMGDKALSFVNRLIDRHLRPNTMYTEAESPVIESPLSGAQSVHDMLIQSWSDWDSVSRQFVSTIRVFPGIPDAWKDAVFRDLRTEHAFLVSARRADGRTEWVALKSLAGKPCRIKPGLNGKIAAIDREQNSRIEPLGNETYRVDLKRDESIVLYAGKKPSNTVITPIDGPTNAYHYFGSGHLGGK